MVDDEARQAAQPLHQRREAGGVANGADAYAKIRAGASLVQLYTGLIYQGPALIARIKRELAALLRRDGFASVSAAVGSGG